MARLVIHSGPKQGKDFLLVRRPQVIGKAAEAGCDIALDHHTVSKRHAVVAFEEGEWLLRDLGSLNGTRVDGKTTDRAPLRDGARIEFGDIVAVFELQAHDVGAPGVTPRRSVAALGSAAAPLPGFVPELPVEPPPRPIPHPSSPPPAPRRNVSGDRASSSGVSQPAIGRVSRGRSGGPPTTGPLPTVHDAPRPPRPAPPPSPSPPQAREVRPPLPPPAPLPPGAARGGAPEPPHPVPPARLGPAPVSAPIGPPAAPAGPDPRLGQVAGHVRFLRRMSATAAEYLDRLDGSVAAARRALADQDPAAALGTLEAVEKAVADLRQWRRDEDAALARVEETCR